VKRIVCEICEGTDFVKENGMFLCRGCGLRYSLEEVKNLLVDVEDSEGSADSGTASGTDSLRINNLYTRARKSLEVDDLEHAAEYYKQILDERPEDWEAYFYAYLGETTSFTNAQAASVAAKLANTIPMAYDMAMESGEANEKAYRAVTISHETAERLTGIAMTAVSLLRGYEGGFALSAQGQVNASLYRNLLPIAQNTIVNCVLAFDGLISKVEEIFRAKQAIDEEAYFECVLSLRRAQVSLANLTFSPTAGVTEYMITQEARFAYQQNLSQAEQLAAAAASRRQAERAAQARKEWEEKKAKREEYWAAHPEEKEALENKKKELEKERAAVARERSEIQEKIKRLADMGNMPVSGDDRIADINKRIYALECELQQLGLLKTTEKRAIRERILIENRNMEKVKQEIRSERDKEIIERMKPYQAEIAEFNAKLQELNDAVKEIDDELNADR